MNSVLETDNEHLRQKLQDQRKENSKLVADNHKLVEELEETKSRLKSSSMKVHNLEESVESFRSKSQELSGFLTVFENASKSNEKDSQNFRRRYEECARQLSESAKLLVDQSGAIRLMKDELDDVKSSHRKTEKERDIALYSAERLQHSYEELQVKLQSTIDSHEQETSVLTEKCDQLVQELDGRCGQIESLQEDVKIMRSDLSAQRNLKKESESRNSELRSQSKNQSAKIEKLEEELENLKRFKVKNMEMKSVMDQQRKRISALEADLRGARAEIENARRQSQKNLVKDKQSLRDAAVVLSQIGAFDIGDILKVHDLERFAAGDSAKVNHPALDVDGLDRLKSDILKLSAGFGESFDGALNQNGDDFQEKLINSRHDRFVAAASILEKRLSNFELLNAKLIAHITQLDSKIAEQRKISDGRASEKETVERDLRTRTQQNVLLEKQLDEKVQEISRHVFEKNSLKSQLVQSKADHARTLADLEEKSEKCLQLMSSIEQMKESHVEQCRDSDEQLAMKDRRCEQLEERLEQSETRCRAMQNSLTQTMQLADVLKDDLNGCRQIELVVLHLEEQLKEAGERTSLLEHEKASLQSDLVNLQQNFQETKSEHQSELSKSSERIGYLKEKLKRAEELAVAKDDEIERLSKENSELDENLKVERNLFESQIETLTENLNKESSISKSLLQNADEELHRIRTELGQKELFIGELVKKNEELTHEKNGLETLASKLENSDRKRMEVEFNFERASTLLSQHQEEVKLLRALYNEQENKTGVLQKRLDQTFEELAEKRDSEKNLRAEIDTLKAEIHTRESQMLELKRRIEDQDAEIKRSKERIKDLKIALTQHQDKLRQTETEVESLNAKILEKDWVLQQKIDKVKSLEVALNERVSVSTASEKRLMQMTEELRESQKNTENRSKHVTNLEDQLQNLLAVVKEQCLKIRKDDDVIASLKDDIDVHKTRVIEVQKIADDLRHDLQRSATVNKQIEAEFLSCREHLSNVQQEVNGSKHELMSVRLDHNNLAKDLAEAALLLKQKDDELTKLLAMLTEAEAIRSRLCDQLRLSEATCDELRSSHAGDLSKLKKIHEATIAIRDNEKRNLQEDLEEAVRQQKILRESLTTLRRQVDRIENNRQVDHSYENQENLSLADSNPETELVPVESKPEFSFGTSHRGFQNKDLSPPKKSVGHSNNLGTFDFTKRQNQQHVYFERSSSSSGIHSDRDKYVPRPCGSSIEGSTSRRDSVSSSSSIVSLAENIDFTADDFLQKMWAHLCESKIGDSCSVKSVHAKSDGNLQTVDDEDDLDLESLDSSSVSVLLTRINAIGEATSSKPTSDLVDARKSKHQPLQIKSQILPMPVKPTTTRNSNDSKDRPLQTLVAPKTLISTAVKKIEPKFGKKTSKLSRSPASNSQLSPTFSSSHLSDPTTAVSYYERKFPTSISDGEIEWFFGDELN